ncbi:hypothetical protein LJ655_21390 [Paraburkholderia sp. MMS20-SJTN17]|uniref:Uncharacterized protein n=1 Tax=Paraburkholderia translucens TaxID=2886945 RepID=A0ABS8KI07_9BURK|nr:hypothetical protein [Paraburkholderia sp. MMS20-SJTN17]MCC8404403.1 hypothetical protein [Paraburkholderia sp. MMS20-SJTN17]
MAHPFDPDDPHGRIGIQSSRASTAHKPLPRFDDRPGIPNEPAIAAAAMASGPLLPTEPIGHTALVSTNTASRPFEDPMYAPRNTAQTIWIVLSLIGAVVAIGLAYVAYALFSDGGQSEEKGVEQITQDARTTTGMIAPLASAPVVSTAQTAQASAALKPATPAVAEIAAKPTPVAPAAPAAPAAPPAAPTVATTPVRPAPQFRDAGQALQVAQTAFRANDLSKAQAALAAAQTFQPGNSNAQSLADQMRPLVQRRDAALQAAQACVVQQSWPCAREHANEALAIDSGNDAAKVILERVIRETGWAPLPAPHAATKGAGTLANGELVATA